MSALYYHVYSMQKLTINRGSFFKLKQKVYMVSGVFIQSPLPCCESWIRALRSIATPGNQSPFNYVYPDGLMPLNSGSFIHNNGLNGKMEKWPLDPMACRLCIVRNYPQRSNTRHKITSYFLRKRAIFTFLKHTFLCARKYYDRIRFMFSWYATYTCKII